jgi:very-short-patch-repair endonuclease
MFLPLSAHWGEREGPGAERREGEVGMLQSHWNPPPHLTSPPPGAERDNTEKLRHRTLIARRLRRNSTEAEKRLWRALQESPIERRFRRQHPIGRRVVDFACPSCKLAIELDGVQQAMQSAADATRTIEITRYGYRVIRFWNNDVMDNLAGVVETILRELESLSR